MLDCAAHRGTLRCWRFGVRRWWLDKLLPINRHLARMVRPMARRVTDLPLPEDDVFEAMTDLVDELQQLHDTLTASKTTTVRLVVNPEKMVIREAQRSYTYLTLYDHITDAVVVNRVVSAEAEGRFAEQRRAMQAPHLRDSTRCSTRSQSCGSTSSPRKWWGWNGCAPWAPRCTRLASRRNG